MRLVSSVPHLISLLVLSYVHVVHAIPAIPRETVRPHSSGPPRASSTHIWPPREYSASPSILTGAHVLDSFGSLSTTPTTTTITGAEPSSESGVVRQSEIPDASEAYASEATTTEAAAPVTFEDDGVTTSFNPSTIAYQSVASITKVISNSTAYSSAVNSESVFAASGTQTAALTSVTAIGSTATHALAPSAAPTVSDDSVKFIPGTDDDGPGIGAAPVPPPSGFGLTGQADDYWNVTRRDPNVNPDIHEPAECNYGYERTLGGRSGPDYGSVFGLPGQIVQSTDIRQGQIGDCGVGASLIALLLEGYEDTIRSIFRESSDASDLASLLRDQDSTMTLRPMVIGKSTCTFDSEGVTESTLGVPQSMTSSLD